MTATDPFPQNEWPWWLYTSSHDMCPPDKSPPDTSSSDTPFPGMWCDTWFPDNTYRASSSSPEISPSETPEMSFSESPGVLSSNHLSMGCDWPSIDSEPETELAKLESFLSSRPTDKDGKIVSCLVNGHPISRVCWNGEWYISGSDIAWCVEFRLRCSNFRVTSLKKIEEGVFSDLRSLTPANKGAMLEEAGSDFLAHLRKHGCIRSRKKQKVFVWGRVKHDEIFEKTC
ncbi:STE like transcription factor-domain-containing protein, partial [Podospora didyma]